MSLLTDMVRSVIKTSARPPAVRPISVVTSDGASARQENVTSAPPRTGDTENVRLVQDFADVLMWFSDDQVHIDKAMRCASYVGRPMKIGVSSSESERRGLPDRFSNWLNLRRNMPTALVPAYLLDEGAFPLVSTRQPQVMGVTDLQQSSAGSQARATVMGFADDVSAFATRAKNAGFVPPDNPFVEITRLNSVRSSRNPVQVDDALASDILFNIRAYVDLLEADAKGAIDFERGTFNAAQLEHISLSYSGLGGSGNAAADLMRLLPDADDIKAKKAAEALSVLNFEKRQPSIIFTAEYSPNHDDSAQGILLGWKRIPDAAGYIVKRHGVLGNSDVSFDITNDQLTMTRLAFMDYVRSYVLTFYDRIHPDNVAIFMDESFDEHEYYIYRVQAYQNKRNVSTSVIPSDFIALNLTNQQKMAISERIKELDPNAIEQLGDETISPWPVFAEQLLGDQTLDWMLAAVNVRAAIDRNETRSISRGYSYLNARTSFLLEQSDVGRLVRPTSIDAIRSAVGSAIQTYGVTQTIEALLQETGILYYFDARDARDDTTFDRAGTLDYRNSGIIGVVAAAIDPETATIDLRVLATNLSQLLSDERLENYTTSLTSGSIEGIRPSEIVVDPDIVSDTIADTGIQYISNMGDMVETSVDLTTFEGISKLVRVIRIMSDFGVNRIPPVGPRTSRRVTASESMPRAILDAEERAIVRRRATLIESIRDVLRRSD